MPRSVWGAKATIVVWSIAALSRSSLVGLGVDAGEGSRRDHALDEGHRGDDPPVLLGDQGEFEEPGSVTAAIFGHSGGNRS